MKHKRNKFPFVLGVIGAILNLISCFAVAYFALGGAWFNGYRFDFGAMSIVIAVMAIAGGVIGVITALILYTKKTKLTMVWTLDNIAIAAPFFSAMVRIGNFMNSEIIGTETDLPWGVIFVQAGETVPHHPAQLYEAIAYAIIFLFGLLLYRKYKAKIGTGLFMGYCLFTIFESDL